jgi:glycosyltransferase involved in cell wall biosynthesis
VTGPSHPSASAQSNGVSVLLPFRDASDTLPAAVVSLQAQTWGDFEVLCIDDQSSDAGSEQLRRQVDGDPRFRLISNPGQGLVAALNAGLTLARFELVARMDADDLMHPRRIELQRARMLQEPDIAVLGSRIEAFAQAGLSEGFRMYIDWQNSCVSSSAIADDIYLEAPLVHPSVMLRRSIIQSAGGYRHGDFPEDYELWLRLNRLGHRLLKLPEPLLQWRDGPARLSRTDTRYRRDAFDALRARYLAEDARVLTASRRLAIWGAGRRTRRRATRLLEHGFQPIAWIDIDPDKIGNRIGDAPVVSPEWLRRRPRPFVLSYVAVHGARARIDAELARLGYRKGRDYLHVG